jgi:predicted amidohydrolase YtcJ
VAQDHTADEMGEEGDQPGLSRREFLAAGAAASAAAALSGPGGTPRSIIVSESSNEGGDLTLINGKIHTMDSAGNVVRAVTIRHGRFTVIGNSARGGSGQVINLRGRTVVPGIIDNHNHIVLMGLRPGYHTPLENAYSIAEVQAALAARRTGVREGEFITTIGGFHSNQFAESRLPTLSELDDAVADRPVYIQISFQGPSTTNSMGREYFEDRGVIVDADGAIAAGPEASGRALLALRSSQTFADQKRSTLDAMAYAASLGVTTHLDQGAFPASGTETDGAAHANLFTMHDAFLALHQEGKVIVRLRINFLNLELDEEVPLLEARLANAFPFFGDDLVRTGGIGEFTAGDPFELFAGPPSEAWKAGTRRVAEEGWRNENHSLTPTDVIAIIDEWEKLNVEVPITGLRWVMAHVPFITAEYVEKLKALGGGLSLTGWRYLAGTATNNGPPFRMIAGSGINVGMSSDGMQIAPMNPWLHMYYATTGVNAAGELINDGQQISREEVLRMYTAANGWFNREEDTLGTIEPGRHADLVVLSDDYFAVSDEDLKRLRSVMTIVDGKIVHDAGVIT